MMGRGNSTRMHPHSQRKISTDPKKEFRSGFGGPLWQEIHLICGSVRILSAFYLIRFIDLFIYFWQVNLDCVVEDLRIGSDWIRIP